MIIFFAAKAGEAIYSQQNKTGSWLWLRSWALHFQGKPFNIMVIQVYAPTSNAEEAEVERFYEDLQDLLEHPKNMSFSLLGTGMQK